MGKVNEALRLIMNNAIRYKKVLVRGVQNYINLSNSFALPYLGDETWLIIFTFGFNRRRRIERQLYVQDPSLVPALFPVRKPSQC